MGAARSNAAASSTPPDRSPHGPIDPVGLENRALAVAEAVASAALLLVLLFGLPWPSAGSPGDRETRPAGTSLAAAGLDTPSVRPPPPHLTLHADGAVAPPVHA